MAKKSRKSSPRAKAAAKRKAAKSKSKPVRKAAKSKSKAKPAPRKAASSLPKDLEARLMALALEMQMTMDALTLQALSEFADAWEDHFRTVKTLQEDDRIQLVVKPEES